MLIAIMLAVVVGMAALAIDGARAYALRRDLQAAVDAAALAAGDNLQQTGSYPSAEQAATAIFGTNLRLYSAPMCAGYGTPGAGSVSVTCNFTGGTMLTQVVSALGPQGARFSLTATSLLQLQFAKILTNGATPTLTATSAGSVNNLLYTPALAALNQAGCGGAAGSAISINGSGLLDVQGDIVSNGAISVSGGSMQVSGDLYARCQATVSGAVTSCYPSDTAAPCTFPNVAGATRTGYHFVDPKYPPPPVVGAGQSWPAGGGDPLKAPGIYAADPQLNNGLCWFLAGGVYKFPNGFTNDGDFVSNELKPPAEPVDSDNTRKLQSRRQFWNTNGVNCAGDFFVQAVGASSPIRTGTWAIEVTSTRTDTFGGLNYFRESAPSYCQTVRVDAGQVIQVQISNVPGATAYNVYAAPPSNGCGGPFGLVGSIQVTGPEDNSDTSGCPGYSGSCGLGTESRNFNSTLLPNSFTPNGAAPGIVGSAPPDSETAPLGSRQVNQNPDRATPPHGDRANENQCDNVAGALTTCPGTITPGAVSIYIPSGGCLTDTNNGDNFVFSGYQYNWIAMYEPGYAFPPANTCPAGNLLDAASNSAYVGLLYTPAAAIDIPTRSSFRTEATGGIMADTITFSGTMPLIVSSPGYSPVPPAAKLAG